MTVTADHAQDVVPALRRGRVRRLLGWVVTALAAVLLHVALIAPDTLGQLTPAVLLRIPVEAVVGLALVLVLRGRARTVVVVACGVLLGLLTVLRLLDIGFLAILARQFNPVLDGPALASGLDFLRSSLGSAATVGLVVLAVAVMVGLAVVMALAALRVTRLVDRHRRVATGALPVLAVAWVVLAVLGTQIVPKVPVAARGAASLAVGTSIEVPTSLRDESVFAQKLAAADPIAATPNLLSALRGKDVVLTFVESYGRSAVEDPGLAPTVDPVLDQGTRTLAAAGFGTRSAFLTSPVAGGGSWLAHATLLSGLWVTNQQRYESLIGTDRLTLTKAFQRGDWRTLAVMPGTFGEWGEEGFYGIDKAYDSAALGDKARVYNRFQTPDQYTLAAFQRSEMAVPGRGPLMAEIPLVTSHWPWANIPALIDWNAVGDGTVYDSMPDVGDPPNVALADAQRARTGYARSIAYSLSSLVSYVQTYGDDNLVLIFLGDHQPAPIVTGEGASHDVPITVVTRDKAVLDSVAGWGWQDGMHPTQQAPVWPMDTFRDRFLTTFSAPDGPQH